MAAKGSVWVGEQINRLSLKEGSVEHHAYHTLIGCLQGLNSGNCSAGAIGANTSILVNQLLLDSSQLSEDQKDQRREFVATIAGLVTVAATGDVQATQVAMQAAVTETDNNHLLAKDTQVKVALGLQVLQQQGQYKGVKTEEIMDVLRAIAAHKNPLAVKGLNPEAIELVKKEIAPRVVTQELLTLDAKEIKEQNRIDGAIQAFGAFGYLFSGMPNVTVDQLQAGLRKLVTGEETHTVIGTGISNSLGINPNTAELIYGVTTGVAAGLKVPELPVKANSNEGKTGTVADIPHNTTVNKVDLNARADDGMQYVQYQDGKGWVWPENLGFKGEKVEATLPIGTKVDRIGEPSGSFLAPAGTPYEARALAPNSASSKVYHYKVVKPLPVVQGEIAPAFGQPGGGVQILPNVGLRVNVEWLVKNGYLKEIE